MVREIARDATYYDVSGGGATFSGGEPLMQPEFLRALLRGCRARGIHTAVDTSGYAEPAALEAVADDVSLFLFDLKLMDDAASRRYTGQSNGPVLRNLEWLARGGRPVCCARRCRIGRLKAAVLPVPVCAMPSRSRPSITEGMDWAWMGVGEE